MFYAGLASLFVLIFIHLFANRMKVLGWIWHGRFLSFAAGISFAYVFVDLLPALEKAQPAVKQSLGSVIPYLDLHVYFISLLGVLFYYGLHSQLESQRNFWLSLVGYLLFNFFVGASLADSSNPEIQPILLFTIAMGMHYFIHDHNTGLHYSDIYQRYARWLLVAALFLGYFIGIITQIPNTVAAVVIAFISGGVFLNAMHYELPKREQVGYVFFLSGALIYAIILLKIGAP